MITLNPQQMPKISDDRLAELAVRVKDGSITSQEKEELTSGFIKFAWHIARGWGSCNHTKVEDYFSCGLFGIAYAIKHAEERLHDQNIAAWIVFQIKSHIQRFRRMDHTVPVPPTTYAKAKREGRDLPVAPAVHALGSAEPCGKLNNVYELREVIDLCARDADDRRIIRLRAEGYTDVEIAEMTGLSKTKVNNKRTAIETRFEKLMSEDL